MNRDARNATQAVPVSEVATTEKMAVEAADTEGGDDSSFLCPEVFSHAIQVELDPGIFVTCASLRPYYELTRLNGVDMNVL